MSRRGEAGVRRGLRKKVRSLPDATIIQRYQGGVILCRSLSFFGGRALVRFCMFWQFLADFGSFWPVLVGFASFFPGGTGQFWILCQVLVCFVGFGFFFLQNCEPRQSPHTT